MAKKKPYHVTVVARLQNLEDGSYDEAIVLLELMAETDLPKGQETVVVGAAIDTAIRFQEGLVDIAAARVITAWDGREILRNLYEEQTEERSSWHLKSLLARVPRKRSRR